MKVIRFYCGKLYYAYAAETKKIAIEAFVEEIGLKVTKCEEIPESKWDTKFISIWDGNYYSKKPYKASIRECICGCNPQLIFTNNSELF